jgi:hypothetical protein
MKPLTQEHFLDVLDQAINQVFSGKGEERHGHGKELESQPWKHITDNVGTGFVIGQALKKLMELKAFTNPEQYKSWKREAIGAIVYITMGIMYNDSLYEEQFQSQSELPFKV